MGKISDRLEFVFVLPLDLMEPLPSLMREIPKQSDVFFDLNERQLDLGLDSNSKDLGEYASFGYKGRFKPVDLKLTGKFRQELALRVTKKDTQIFSDDSKSPVLQKRYGKDIFGVAKMFHYILGEALLPGFADDVKRKIRKNFK